MNEMTDREARRFDESLAAAERARNSPAEPRTFITPREFEASGGVQEHRSVRLSNALNRYAMEAQSRKARIDVDACTTVIRRIMSDIDELHRLTIKPAIEVAAASLSNAERAESLIAGVVAIAKKLRGGWCYGSGRVVGPNVPGRTIVDALADTSPQREFWRNQSPGLVANLLKEPHIADALEAQGVLAWAAKDGGARVVNINWLEDPAEIAEFVKAEPEPGRRCRFCCTFEPDDSMELESFERPEKRPTVTSTGWAGRKRVLDYSRVSVHGRCRSYWERWLQLADNFEPPEAA